MKTPIRTLFIGGTHPRHLYFINRIMQHPRVKRVGVLLQEREDILPPVPPGTQPHDAELWRRHFSFREAKEATFFRGQKPPHDSRIIAPEELNTEDTARSVEWDRPDLCLVFGSGMIREPLLSALPTDTINMHLGLSPRYRGAATLFWPFYFLEPNWAGVTFHRLVNEPDAGKVLHQCRPNLLHRDTLHDVACRAVVHATMDMFKLLDRWPDWEFMHQRATGKNFLASDFQPAHLRPIYDVWNDQIVDAYLRGEIGKPNPKLWQENVREVE